MTVDLALTGGKVWTPAHPSGFVQAVAVSGGQIAALGGDDEIRELTGPKTRVVDLGGRLAIPAFGDAHIHAVSGGLESLRCDLTAYKTRQDYLDTIAAYAAGLPPDAWVLGGGWSMPAFPGGTPTAADLDPVTGGRPAFLPNRDHHSAWVNTAALELAGIDARTPDPADGRIERTMRDERSRGNATGALHDGAMRLVADHVPPASPEELTAGLLAAQKYLHSLGITSFQDACVGDARELGVPDSFDTYRRAASDGLLTAQVTGALWWRRDKGLGQIDDLLTRREAAGAGAFRATSVKLMLDGVCETFTAAMAEPYLDGHGHVTSHRGELFIDPAELATSVMAMSELGFQLHFHAIGDRAVTTALDALATLPAAARERGRHHLAHLQFIRPTDLDRFAALGAIANFQPLWACAEDQMTELTIPFVGNERTLWQYQIGALRARGARIAFGSDWPVSSPNPLQEIHVAVNRVPPDEADVPPFLPSQAVSVGDSLAAFTSGVAYVNHAEDVTGTLLPGLRGDVAVLGQDVFSVPARDLGSVPVVMTVAGGTIVHDDIS
jgi:predicted amidohydrolase YtcJ